MVPEISHRCPACGASTHDFGEGVLFCPECGKPLAAAKELEPSAEKPDGETADVSPHLSIATETAVTETDPPAPDKILSRTPDERASARERTRETLQRASRATRGAIEDNVKRVEKIHHVSSVMLEEAHYDPSLRFVLVALGLFVLFVVLLVLSKVMG